MEKALITIGDRIEMRHVKSATRRKLSTGTLTSQLLDYDGLRTAKISVPIWEGKIIPLEVGDEFDLCFFTTAGLYRCRSRVGRRYREGKMHVMQMTFLTVLKKYQRRQYYRLDCTMDIRFRKVGEEERRLREFLQSNVFEDEAVREAYVQKLEEYAGEWLDARLTDISGGGIRFQSEEEIDADSFVEVVIPLRVRGDRILFRSFAKVIALAHVQATGKKVNEERCEFYQVDEDMRELVVKYVFEEQKRRLRKE